MKILINGINLTSAGTRATAVQLFATLDAMDSAHQFVVLIPKDAGLRPEGKLERLEVIEYPPWKGPAYPVWRLWFDFVVVPKLVRWLEIDAVFALGNHLPGDIDVPGIVLYRNPHYVEADHDLGFAKRMEKRLFARTVKRGRRFIAQSDVMRHRLSETWDIPNERIAVIPNALSRAYPQAIEPRAAPNASPFRLLYVSRYYPHKNHAFLIDLAARFLELGVDDVEIRCTVNRTGAGKRLWRRIQRRGLERIIDFVGELDEQTLAAEYDRADALIFPSTMETFGNPFLEAMSYALPILAADLPYAHEICGDAAIYFSLDRPDDARRKIETLRLDRQRYTSLSSQSAARLQAFPNWQEVARRYISVIEDEVAAGAS